MTPTEAAALLTCAAAFDNRKPDADSATAWALALEGLRFVDCRDAIVAHYRNGNDWLMPNHVRVAVKRLREDRLLSAPPLSPPPELDPDDPDAYTAWLFDQRRRIADGEDVTTPVAEISQRDTSAIKALIQRVPAATTSESAETDPDWQRRKEAARAELDGLRERLAAQETPADHPRPQPPGQGDSVRADREEVDA